MGNLRKAKTLYVTKQQEYEKARDLANKAESESPASQQGAKKRKQEEDAMHRVRVQFPDLKKYGGMRWERRYSGRTHCLLLGGKKGGGSLELLL